MEANPRLRRFNQGFKIYYYMWCKTNNYWLRHYGIGASENLLRTEKRLKFINIFIGNRKTFFRSQYFLLPAKKNVRHCHSSFYI